MRKLKYVKLFENFQDNLVGMTLQDLLGKGTKEVEGGFLNTNAFETEKGTIVAISTKMARFNDEDTKHPHTIGSTEDVKLNPNESEDVYIDPDFDVEPESKVESYPNHKAKLLTCYNKEKYCLLLHNDKPLALCEVDGKFSEAEFNGQKFYVVANQGSTLVDLKYKSADYNERTHHQE